MKLNHTKEEGNKINDNYDTEEIKKILQQDLLKN